MAGHGWHESYGTLERSRYKCSNGNGEIVEYKTYTEESDYPPFERGGHTYCEAKCPENCEKLNSCEERKRFNG